MSCRGVVERYDRKRGFGHIRPDAGGECVFVHWSNIVSSETWPSLKKGLAVVYDTAIDDNRRGEPKEVAMNVTDAEGNPVAIIDEGQAKNLSRDACTGTVKFFSRRGFGFVTIDRALRWPTKVAAGTDIYVSREDLVVEEGTVCTLRNGHRVQFRAYAGAEEAIKAGAVQNEDGTPLNFGEVGAAGEDGERPWVKSNKGEGKGFKSGKFGQGKAVTPRFTKSAPPASLLRPQSGSTPGVIKTVVKPFATGKGWGKKGKK